MFASLNKGLKFEKIEIDTFWRPLKSDYLLDLSSFEVNFTT